MTHRYDNEARLDEIIARGPAEFVILHGSDDEVIPAEMGAKLAQGRGKSVRLIEIDGARHNDIAQTHPGKLARALRDIGR